MKKQLFQLGMAFVTTLVVLGGVIFMVDNYGPEENKLPVTEQETGSQMESLPVVSTEPETEEEPEETPKKKSKKNTNN